MKISVVTLSALAALSLYACHDPQPKEETINNSGNKHPAIDSMANVNKDSLVISDDYCPPCGRG